jgi:aryl-alcohol dehydrogenase-like predicted oxidoreductase
VAEALAAWGGDQSTVTVATKGGHVRDRHGRWDVDGRPQHLIDAAHASRKRLGVDTIALYQFHRPDPSVDFITSVEALAQLQRDEVVSRVGLSNVDVAQVQRAVDVIDVASIQNELSPMALESLPVVQWCHDARVPFIVWAPFGGRERGRGLADDPDLQPFATHGAEVGASIHQVVLAWLLSLSPMVVPIPGASRPSTITQSLAAGTIVLDDDTVATLDRAAAQAAAEPRAGQWLEQLRARTADVEV